MKQLTFKKLATSLVLSSIALSVFAAPANGPKPSCSLGKIAVVENNIWVCQEATIKAKDQTTSRLPIRQLDKASPAKPERAKPDLSIANILKQNSPNPNIDTFKVYVKNTEGVASPATKMSLHSPKGGGEVSVPSLPANGGQWVEVSFFKFDQGDRILLMADAHQKVPETNESNNKYAFNW